MALFQSDDIMKALLAKLYSIVNGGDDFAPANKNNFISWVMPGMPISPDDLTFLAKGFNGKDASETRDLVRKAADFALFTDLVPDPTAVYNMKQGQTIDRNSQEALSRIYGNILKFAKVTDTPPTAAEKAKMDKFQKLLYATQTDTDPLTDVQTTHSVPTPLMQAYTTGEQAYEDAALLYNGKRINAAASDDKAAVIDFDTNALIYRNKVKTAMNAWTSAGHKNDVEEMQAYIAQVTGRSMASWFAGLRDNYDKAVYTESDLDITFYPVRIFPPNFYSQPWQNFYFKDSSMASHTDSSSTAWGVSAGVNFGLWSAKASASGSTDRQNANFKSSMFNISFELTQVKILRPWFGTELFSCQGWKLDPGTWKFGSPQLSDGKNPPSGSFIAYSTNMIFVRNLKVDFDKAAWQSSDVHKQLQTSANVGWGPFTLKGNYSHSSASHDFQSTDTGSGVSCPGMQLIGFVNRLVGTCPNPDPKAKFD